jgi:hypothetical protein
MVIPTKSSSAFRSPFPPRRSSVVRLHNSRRWHSSASRRASFGGLVRTLPSLATHLTSVFPHTDPTSQARFRHDNQPRRHPRLLPHRQPRRRLHRPHHRPRALFHLRPRHPHLRRPTHRHALPLHRPRRHGLRYRPLSRRYHRAKSALPYSLDGTEPRGNVW